MKQSVSKWLVGLTIVFPPLQSFSYAHEPLFMMSHEAPGKGAFDLHAAFHHERHGDETEREFASEFTLGFTRDVALQMSFPYASISEDAPSGLTSKSSFSDPSARIKWRFWDKDLLGKKYAAAFAFQSTIPTGSETGRKKPVFLTGLSHGREGLRWYYFVDTRYRYAVAEADGSRPGDQIWLDAAYGIRPRLRKLEETDVVFFVEVNYLRERPGGLTGGAKNTNSGGDFLFISPEVLISPNNRIMFKGGVQIPIAQSLNGNQEKRGLAVVVEVEFRFGF
ncbi:hypothetical protein MYX78_02375 [Acidobacteria bacterium AH-259-G07]|nr:hypothetical protein [Acidobacteria bacterium AH-259-G07]